ncbi:ferredoxin reductase [Paractinoplanes rhizophilus]|uniref:Ferredoxin reductase n=1 Tax=Paractinoplanes rhizophilus TaxID=1416877 RepID=A0ABW2HSU4_9ACTN
MARTALLGRLNWLTGMVVASVPETPDARTIGLEIPDWPGHRAGQHVDLRLTAEDGYRAERSYSIASAPSDTYVELTVERVPGGEVSSYLVDDLRMGDRLELRGPVGGYFVWDQELGGPLLLVAGGSGIVPLRSMLRHHRAIHSSIPVRLLYSVRDPDGLIYAREMMRFATSDEIDVNLTYTRATPPGWHGYGRRIDAEMVADVAWTPADRALTYVCGPTTFVEAASNLLVAAGHAPGRIRAERFGGTEESK